MIETRTKSGFRDTRFLSVTALLIAIGVLLPMIFHQFGIAGKVFGPMPFPVIIAGLLLGPLSGALVGLLSPALSFLLTGMPPFPLVLAMVPELMAYGAVSGWLHRRLKINIWIALPGAILSGRIVLGLAWWVLFQVLDLPVSPLVFVAGGLAVGLPGIIGQILLIPLIVRGIRRAW
ncbi:MAG: ECF transporter S component [Candidatus Latescibacterota bacterium]